MPQLFALREDGASECEFPRSIRDFRQPVSWAGLHDRDRLPGVYLGLPEDRPARFRHADVPLRAGSEMRGTEEPEAISSAVPQRGHFLRARDEPHFGRPRGYARTSADGAYRRLHAARRDYDDGYGR